MSDRAERELYDGACELVFAAQALRRASDNEGNEAAITATLGCLTEALEAIHDSADRLSCRLTAASSSACAVKETARNAFAELVMALAAAECACDAARATSAALQGRPTARG